MYVNAGYNVHVIPFAIIAPDTMIENAEKNGVKTGRWSDAETKNVIDRFILGVGSIRSWGAVILIAVIILQVCCATGSVMAWWCLKRRNGTYTQSV